MTVNPISTAARTADAARSGAVAAPAVGGRALPLSFGQQRLWFLQYLDPDSPAYNTFNGFRIHGLLKPTLLARALNELVDRHEILRTRFPSVDGQPLQVVQASQHIALPIVDLMLMPAEAQRREAQWLSREEAVRPFDIAQGPLLRAILMRLDRQDHLVLYTMHHIASDGWSQQIFVRDVKALYYAAATGTTPRLPKLPIQYADYAVWQRETIRGERLRALTDYWERQLVNMPDLLDLPADRPRRNVVRFQGAVEQRALSSALCHRLGQLRDQERITIFMIMLLGLQVLFAKYTDRRDIPVGVPTAGRSRTELEDLIGFFVNTLVMRTDLSGDPTVRVMLERVREVALGANAHEDLPFELLVERLRPDRSTSHAPLIQFMFDVVHSATSYADDPDATLVPVSAHTGTAKFDAIIYVRHSEQGTTIVAEYNIDLFDVATIRRMLAHYECVLEGMVANPEARLSELSTLTHGERQRLLGEWGRGPARPVQPGGIHEWILRGAATRPTAIALRQGDETLDYRELTRRVAIMAARLRALGVSAEVPVAVYLPRSSDMIVGLLGVLHAGGVWVPIDPGAPRERAGWIIRRSGAKVVLTRAGWLDGVDTAGVHVCLPDETWWAPSSDALATAGVTLTPVDAAQLAYVIYTSGSTGEPKGVMVSHGSLANFVQIVADCYDIQPHDRVLQFSSASFDVCVEEIFPCLMRGGTLVLRQEAMLNGAHEFWAGCREAGVTVVSLPTAFWHQLATVETSPSELGRLRLLIVGGERVLAEHVVRWQRQHGARVRMVNGYGPTEATVFATWHDVAAVPPPDREVPIGRPLANAHTYVLDAHLQPVPVGVRGELYLGGPGVARGYRHLPAQTAAAFVPDPFADTPGARLYRTGDYARYLATGELEFLGRHDHQVKLRGFRVELGEVEAVLMRHPAVQQAVTLVHEERAGTKRLVAYVVLRPHTPQAGNDSTPPAAPRPSDETQPRVMPPDVVQYVTRHLPSHMVPSTFVVLEALPLTANGKVDVRALAAPKAGRAALDVAFVPPQSDTQRRIARIWQDVLAVDRVGVRDNFFDLGGHSLLVIQVNSRLRDAFGLDLPILELFRFPTIEALALCIDEARAAAGERETP